jgi:hypothetical protein
MLTTPSPAPARRRPSSAEQRHRPGAAPVSRRHGRPAICRDDRRRPAAAERWAPVKAGRPPCRAARCPRCGARPHRGSHGHPRWRLGQSLWRRPCRPSRAPASALVDGPGLPRWKRLSIDQPATLVLPPRLPGLKPARSTAAPCAARRAGSCRARPAAGGHPRWTSPPPTARSRRTAGPLAAGTCPAASVASGPGARPRWRARSRPAALRATARA